MIVRDLANEALQVQVKNGRVLACAIFFLDFFFVETRSIVT